MQVTEIEFLRPYWWSSFRHGAEGDQGRHRRRPQQRGFIVVCSRIFAGQDWRHQAQSEYEWFRSVEEEGQLDVVVRQVNNVVMNFWVVCGCSRKALRCGSLGASLEILVFDSIFILASHEHEMITVSTENDLKHIDVHVHELSV